MKKKLRPLNGRVVIRYELAPDITKGGIVVPDSAKKVPTSGVVQACSRDVRAVKVGDAVLFDKYAVMPIEIEGEPRYLLAQSDILGVWES